MCAAARCGMESRQLCCIKRKKVPSCPRNDCAPRVFASYNVTQNSNQAKRQWLPVEDDGATRNSGGRRKASKGRSGEKQTWG